jgi:hypothetical protein
MPAYNQYVEGKLRDSVVAQALSQAREIQAQEIVLTGTVLPDIPLRVGTPLNVTGTGLPAVDGQDFVVTRLSPSFSIEHGFVFNFTAWEDDAPIGGQEGTE